MAVTGLWRDPEFLKLWGSETLSVFGTQVTTLALPLTAVSVLHASPTQMGVLGACNYAAFLLFTLPLGVFVDQCRKKGLLVAANLGRAGLLAMVPLGAGLGWLRMELLYPLAFLVGLLTVLFHLAYNAYVPGLVGTAQVLEGNAKLQSSASAAEIAGPGLGGVLVAALGAPYAVALDAASYVFAGFGVAMIRRPETAPPLPAAGTSLTTAVLEGLRTVFHHPILRAMAITAGGYNAFSQASATLFVLYATRELGFQASTIGLLFSVGGVGALLGAALSGVIAARVGLGWAMIVTTAVSYTAALLVPLAAGGQAVVVAVIGSGFFISGLGVAASTVHFLSLRQTLTPPRLQGRVTASYRTVSYGVLPVGALLFGYLADHLGLRPALWVGAVGVTLSWLPILFSPVRGLKQMPEAVRNPD